MLCRTEYIFAVLCYDLLLTVDTRVRTIVQKTDSPIADGIGQNYRPMR